MKTQHERQSRLERSAISDALTRDTMTPVPPSSTIQKTAEELIEYLLRVGHVLLNSGCPVYRVENLMVAVGTAEGHGVEAFALPTGLFLTVIPKHGHSVHRMIRVADAGLNLSRLVTVDSIFNRVLKKELSLDQAKQLLQSEVFQRRERQFLFILRRYLGVVGTTASAALFFRGGLNDVLVSILMSTLLHAIIFVLKRNSSARFLADFLYSIFAAVMSYFFSKWFPGVLREVLILASVVTRFPGMTLTTGLAELTQKNLVSGGARMMDAFITLLSLVLGVAVASAVGKGTFVVDFDIVEKNSPHLKHALISSAKYIEWAVIVIASLSHAVKFGVPNRFLWSSILSGSIGYTVSNHLAKPGPHTMPLFVASLLASLCVCMFANAMARIFDRPSQIYQLPGMMLLVPGTFGFLSLEDFASGNTTTGAEQAIKMVLVAGGLAVGVISANVIVHPRKIL